MHVVAWFLFFWSHLSMMELFFIFLLSIFPYYQYEMWCHPFYEIFDLVPVELQNYSECLSCISVYALEIGIRFFLKLHDAKLMQALFCSIDWAN